MLAVVFLKLPWRQAAGQRLSNGIRAGLRSDLAGKILQTSSLLFSS